jgi:hypothetical protein
LNGNHTKVFTTRADQAYFGYPDGFIYT